MRYRNRVLALALSLIAWACAHAEDITGTVTNATVNRPAAGAEVVLLSLSGGMNEVGMGTADKQGHFSIHIPDPGVTHLLRVNHQGVNYFQDAPPGAANAEITVYDAGKDVAGIFEVARVYRMQTENGQLEVEAKYTLRNESSPQRTRLDKQTFEVELPSGALLGDASATGPGGLPVGVPMLPAGKQNRYGLVFPIRPGQTEFRVRYKVPYTGSYEFNVASDSQLAELGVLLPKSMKFTGLGRTFNQDRDEQGLAVFFTTNVPAHEPVKFSVTGEGLAPREAQDNEGPASNAVADGASADGAPAGSTPAQAPGGSNNTPWYIAGVMALAVAGGAYWLWLRSRQNRQAGDARATGRTKPDRKKSAAGRPERAATASKAAADGDLLEALKDELFQLERERAEGKVSQEQYEKTKAGLDSLIRRQLKKMGQG